MGPSTPPPHGAAGARLDPPLETPARLYYRWKGTGNLGDFDRELETNSDRGTIRYRANSEGLYGEDLCEVEVFMIENGRPQSLGQAKTEIRVEARRSVIYGSYVVDTEIIGERYAVTAVIQVPYIANVKSYTVQMKDSYDKDYWGDGKRFGIRKYPPYDKWGENLRQKPGGVHWIGLSGSYGGGDPGWAQSWMDGRFSGFKFKVVLTYK